MRRCDPWRRTRGLAVAAASVLLIAGAVVLPHAALAGLAAVAGLTLQSADLHAEAAAAKLRIDTLVAESTEHRALVALELQDERFATGDEGAKSLRCHDSRRPDRTASL